MEGSAAKSSRRWRISAAEIAASVVLIPGDSWHPLDGGIAPEYVPDQWDGIHVGVRLIDAFRTLSAMPGGFRNGGATGFWPAYFYTWDDLLAQQTAEKVQQEDDARARNRTSARPSAQEISRMDHAISWPGRYIMESSLARLVQVVALARSRDLDLRHAARKLKMGDKTVRDRNRNGLDTIAAGLRRDAVRVF